MINLNPTVGAEIRKTRPAIILNDDALGILPLKIIVPITDWKDTFIKAPWMVRIDPQEKNNLTKISAADTFQIRSISVERFVRRVGEVDEVVLEKMSKALKRVLSIK